jgi:[CysO sulfur-carrier protein]-S-L-cysteine hydrolase
MNMIRLQREHVNQIFTHARETDPAECCGLIGGTNDDCATSIYRLRNVSRDERVSYEAAPEELFAAQRQMRQHDEQLIAIYHSHPQATDPHPSETDVRLAFYPSVTYLIIGLGGTQPTMRAFLISERESRWQPVEYAIADE